MKGTVKVLGVVGLVLASAGSASASDSIASGTPTSAEGSYFCVALEDPAPATPKGRALYSAIFTADGNMLNPVRAEFVQFVQEKFAYAQDPTTLDNSIQCVSGQTADETAAAMANRIRPGKQLNPDGTIETGWSPS